MRYLIDLIFGSRAYEAQSLGFYSVKINPDGSMKTRLAIRLSSG